MKILSANEIKEIAGGINNPGYNHLDIAVKEGALTSLLVVPPTLLIAYGIGVTSPYLALGAGIGFLACIYCETALAYFDVPATYIFYPNDIADSI
ncbi:hypothetical protein [Candidatus Berkiella aquae]|uniref:Uncharacterized protein n=1 Tax=Candidatus Berkiella aquae TaxID=295108 RepID=A0A0Q9YQX2_9GAMM|nr:hypothetical protein [Candidatus Berkiella aquae]MCS5711647.1 hypothetical protein [Candidatus Berkiella aquae]